VRFPVGTGSPGKLERGDLDGDGIVDVALTLNEYSDPQPVSSVALLYLGRNGIPVPARTLLLEDARRAMDVAIAELDGDGDSDVAVLDGHGEVLVYLQRSDGTFEDPFPYAVGDNPQTLIAEHWNGDGAIDLLSANYSSGDVSVLLGNGDGTFAPARFSPMDSQYLSDAAAGDFDGDGALDVAVVNSYTTEGKVLLGTGDGYFGTPQPFSVGSYASAVRVGELTGDAFLDIVETNYNTRDLRVLEGDGTGAFTDGFQFSVGSAAIGSVEIADLNRDGIADLVLGSSYGLTPLLGVGGGDFEAKPPSSPGGYPGNFSVDDVDGDLVPDALLLVSEGYEPTRALVAFLGGRGNGTFEGPCTYDAGPEPRGLVIGDYVYDGVPDLAVGNYSFGFGAISVLGGKGDGSFAARIETTLPYPPTALTSVDLDGNTLADLVLASGSSLSFLSSMGNGLFDPPFAFPAGGQGTSAIEVAELDGDLVLDLLVANSYSNQIAVHLGNPGASFDEPLRFGTGVSPGDAVVVDLDGDGIPDTAVTNRYEQTVSVLLGRGDGFFLPDVAYPACNEPTELLAADLDGNGILDLVVTCMDTSTGEPEGIMLLPGFGDGSFGPPQPIAGLQELSPRMRLADLNHDGSLDLFAGAGYSKVAVALQRGPGFFDVTQEFTSSGGIADLGSEDLDGDGKTDIVLVDYSGQALVFLNQGP